MGLALVGVETAAGVGVNDGGERGEGAGAAETAAGGAVAGGAGELSAVGGAAAAVDEVVVSPLSRLTNFLLISLPEKNSEAERLGS